PIYPANHGGSADEPWAAPRRKVWHRWKGPRIRRTRKKNLVRRRERQRQLWRRDQEDCRAPTSPTQSSLPRSREWERSHHSQYHRSSTLDSAWPKICWKTSRRKGLYGWSAGTRGSESTSQPPPKPSLSL